MLRSEDGSTRRLVELCGGYFVFYVITGLTVKYFLAPASKGFPGYDGLEFLAYSTFSSMAVCMMVVLPLGWWKLETTRSMRVLGRELPSELLYIIPSGICTGVVIPTTTLMYSLPISVMVAMVIMRASVIVISRAVDAIQIRQGILHKAVYWQENVAIGFALGAVGVHLVVQREGGFDFVKDPAAMTILGSYITAYALRIYIMNYYKNTAGRGAKRDNRPFFGIEQISATLTVVVAFLLTLALPTLVGAEIPQVEVMRRAVTEPRPSWGWASLAGSAFGVVAFFSVFIFMFKGRTATFAGLVNRLTSLLAGTTSTLLFWLFFGGRFPKLQDWISLGFILVAVVFLTFAERRRAAELATQPG